MELEIYHTADRWFKVAWIMYPPLLPPPLEYAGLSRFDVSGQLRSIPTDELSDVIYLASDEVTAICEFFGRKLGRRSTNPSAPLTITDPSGYTWEGGIVPREQIDRCVMITTQINPAYRFVKVEAPKTIAYLRRVDYVLDIAQRHNHTDVDLGALHADERAITQATALHVYKQIDASGRPLFDGIAYTSRHGEGMPCLAVFASRVPLNAMNITPLAKCEAALAQAFNLMNVTHE